jgi:hypothetical protein
MRTVAEVPSVFMPTSRALTTVETRALGSAGRTCAWGLGRGSSANGIG